jgi:hypothetical protein
VNLSSHQVLPVGETVVTYTARDASGNVATLKVKFRVGHAGP